MSCSCICCAAGAVAAYPTDRRFQLPSFAGRCAYAAALVRSPPGRSPTAALRFRAYARPAPHPSAHHPDVAPCYRTSRSKPASPAVRLGGDGLACAGPGLVAADLFDDLSAELALDEVETAERLGAGVAARAAWRPRPVALSGRPVVGPWPPAGGPGPDRGPGPRSGAATGRAGERRTPPLAPLRRGGPPSARHWRRRSRRRAPAPGWAACRPGHRRPGVRRGVVAGTGVAVVGRTGGWSAPGSRARHRGRAGGGARVDDRSADPASRRRDVDRGLQHPADLGVAAAGRNPRA